VTVSNLPLRLVSHLCHHFASAIDI